MKKVLLITMAALSILFTQCKKTDVINSTPATEEGVHITLSVDDGSKLIVTPGDPYCTVGFTSGDVIYVASNCKYVGTLTHNGANFAGTITNPAIGQPLFFYFLGNKTPEKTLETGTTDSIAVSIADQSEGLPVISAAESRQNYSSYTTEYTATLLNRCGLVKFTAAKYTGKGTIIIKKMNNKVTVDLSKNLGEGAFTNNSVDEGLITLNKVITTTDTAYWAILLPQGEVTGSAEGDARSTDEEPWTGTFDTVKTIGNNSYESGGVAISLIKPTQPTGDYVDFGQGIGWATCNLGAKNGTEPASWYGDYYSWGETETKESYTEDNYLYTDNPDTLPLGRDAAHAKLSGDWRMPTAEECRSLIDNNTFEWLKEGDQSKYVSSFTAVAAGYLVVKGGKKGVSLDNNVHMFLPAGGTMGDDGLESAGEIIHCWSSSIYTGDNKYARGLYGDVENGVIVSEDSEWRYYGKTVRPVLTLPKP